MQGKTNAVVNSGFNNYSISSDFCILRNITNYQPDKINNVNDWPIPSNLDLADSYFFKPQKIDMLLGAEVFFELLEIGQINLGNNYPIIQKTLLGWVIAGKCGASLNNNSKICNLVTEDAEIESMANIDKVLQKFWLLEDVPKTSLSYTDEQLACEKHYIDSTQIIEIKIVVRLPFKNGIQELGTSYETA